MSHGSIKECISLAESALHDRQSSLSHEQINSHTENPGDCFSRLDCVDEKIANCIKLTEDTLSLDNPNKMEHPEFVNPWASDLLSDNSLSNRLDKYLADSHPKDETIPIDNYVSRWHNVIHQASPDDQASRSPTSAIDERMPPLLSPKEIENLDNFNNFMNESSI